MLIARDNLTVCEMQKLQAMGYVIEIDAEELYAKVYKEEANEASRLSQAG